MAPEVKKIRPSKLSWSLVVPTEHAERFEKEEVSEAIHAILSSLARKNKKRGRTETIGTVERRPGSPTVWELKPPGAKEKTSSTGRKGRTAVDYSKLTPNQKVVRNYNAYIGLSRLGNSDEQLEALGVLPYPVAKIKADYADLPKAAPKK